MTFGVKRVELMNWNRKQFGRVQIEIKQLIEKLTAILQESPSLERLESDAQLSGQQL